MDVATLLMPEVHRIRLERGGQVCETGFASSARSLPPGHDDDLGVVRQHRCDAFVATRVDVANQRVEAVLLLLGWQGEAEPGGAGRRPRGPAGATGPTGQAADRPAE